MCSGCSIFKISLNYSLFSCNISGWGVSVSTRTPLSHRDEFEFGVVASEEWKQTMHPITGCGVKKNWVITHHPREDPRGWVVTQTQLKWSCDANTFQMEWSQAVLKSSPSVFRSTWRTLTSNWTFTRLIFFFFFGKLLDSPVTDTLSLSSQNICQFHKEQRFMFYILTSNTKAPIDQLVLLFLHLWHDLRTNVHLCNILIKHKNILI